MTEVPEHLLARSKAARAKATGGGGDGDAGAPPASPGEAPGTGAAASAVEPAGQTAPAAAAAPEPEPPKPLPPYVAAAERRPRVPRFAIPVLAALPVWALIYAGTMGEPGGPEDPELALGERIYASACSGCHGAGGQGGTGRPLGQVVAVFPDRADHVAWVVEGSPAPGTPYGDPTVGRISQEGAWAAMPGFGNSLSPEEIAAVVRYEREHFGGEEASPTTGEETAEGGNEAGTSTNEAEAQGGDTTGRNPETSPDAGVEGSGGGTTTGNPGGGADASPSGDEGGDQLQRGAG